MLELVSPLAGLRGKVRRRRNSGPVADPHRYWLIEISASGGDNYSEIRQLEMYESAGGRNVAVGGTPFASSAFGGNVAANAFDGDLTTSWIGSTATFNQQIGIDLGAGNERDINAIGIFAATGGFHTRAPSAFTVRYSDNGVDYVTKWTVSGVSWASGEFKRFNNPDYSPTHTGSPFGEHDEWRVVIGASESGAPCIGEIEFRATPGGGEQQTGGTPNASTNFSGTFNAPKAYDRDINTAWSSTGDDFAWNSYLHASPVRCAQVAIRARNDSSPNTCAKNFAIQYRDGAGAWSTAWGVSGEIGWALGERRLFTDPAYAA